MDKATGGVDNNRARVSCYELCTSANNCVVLGFCIAAYLLQAAEPWCRGLGTVALVYYCKVWSHLHFAACMNVWILLEGELWARRLVFGRLLLS
jgi:hypothetical protein